MSFMLHSAFFFFHGVPLCVSERDGRGKRARTNILKCVRYRRIFGENKKKNKNKKKKKKKNL